MQYYEICPIWIINTLGDNHAFPEKMEHQLCAFSSNEFGSVFDEKTYRWWNISNLSSINDISIDDKYHPSDIPAYDLPAGNFDVSALTVVILTSLETFSLSVEIAKELRKRQRDGSFMKGSATLIRYYGLLVFNKDSVLNEDLKSVFLGVAKTSKSRKKKEPEPLPFDTLFLQSNCNRVATNAQDYSYDYLEPEDSTDLSVQIVYHLALTQGVLSNVNGKPLCVAGAFSLYFEANKWKYLTAKELSDAIFEKFRKDQIGEHWHKESEAMYSDEFAQEQGWVCIYGNLKAGFRNIDNKDVVPQSTISPWRLFPKYLIPHYFKKFIKGLVRQIHNNTSAYSYLALHSYHNHVDNQFQKMTHNGVQQHKIESELLTIWDKESDDHAIGMQQFLAKLNKIIDFFTSQKESVQKLLDKKEADKSAGTFPELADLPLGNFGDFQGRYASYVRSQGMSGTKDDVTDRGKLLKLKRVLSFHAVPLSLLVRSLLLGILFPLVVLTILNLIPDQVIDTSWFESHPGNKSFFVACFIVSVSWAILKYHFLVVDNIRQIIKDYIGWCIYCTQVDAYRLTLEKAKDFYENAITICNEIKKRTEVFIESETSDGIDESIGFENNKFQADVMAKFEEKDILKKDTVCVMVNVSFKEYGQEIIREEKADTTGERTDDIHYGVLRRVLMLKDDILMNILKALLFKEEEKDSQNDASSSCQPDFFNQMTLSIKEELKLYLRDLSINSLSDIVLPTTGESLNKWDGKSRNYTIGDMIRERSYPSAEAISAFHLGSFVIPNRDKNDIVSWRNLLNIDGSLDDTRYDTIKGMFGMSILQGAAISSISQVRDLKYS